MENKVHKLTTLEAPFQVAHDMDPAESDEKAFRKRFEHDC
jgi:hypothetical protein